MLMTRPTSYSISLSFKYDSIAVVLIGPLELSEWFYEIGFICPSVLLPVQISLNFAMVLGVLIKLCVTAGFFLLQKFGEMGQNGFLNSKKNLVVSFHWICSIIKIYIICCVAAQIQYLRKILFLRYRQKCALSQSDCRIFKSTISPK